MADQIMELALASIDRQTEIAASIQRTATKIASISANAGTKKKIFPDRKIPHRVKRIIRNRSMVDLILAGWLGSSDIIRIMSTPIPKYAKGAMVDSSPAFINDRFDALFDRIDSRIETEPIVLPSYNDLMKEIEKTTKVICDFYGYDTNAPVTVDATHDFNKHTP